MDGSAIAISGLIAESEAEAAKAARLKMPILRSIVEAAKLANLVEKLLSG